MNRFGLVSSFAVATHKANGLENVWIQNVKNILNKCGLTYIFENPQMYNREWLVSQVEQTLTDQFIQGWQSDIVNSSKALYYRHFKQMPTFENYLLLPKSIYYPILKFRTSNHILPIETGRWQNILPDNRICKLCNSTQIGDEFHYLFRCQALSIQRLSFIPKQYYTWPNLGKMKLLMNSKKANQLKCLSKFLVQLHNLLLKH